MANWLGKFGLWRCSRGHHAPLQWVRATTWPVTVDSRALEMFYASGMGQFAKWNGWCPRCWRAVEWSDHKPKGGRTLLEQVAGDETP